MTDGIVFQVETSRILKLLATEIYDSPLAMLRENVQNAYDAIRERFASSGALTPGGQVELTISPMEIIVRDNGIGMTEEVLRENFWKAGSSGKHSERARKAGVVGTFGIGAMANFGVCTRIVVETRAADSGETLISTADRDDLKIGEECIKLSTSTASRETGTTLILTLDPNSKVSVEAARQYIEPYVKLLPVPVLLNGQLISTKTVNDCLPVAARGMNSLNRMHLSDNLYEADFHVFCDANAIIRVDVSEIRIGGNSSEGAMMLLQNGGQLMGLRSYFGLAPIPVAGHYQFGGIANLPFLHPTAGREAISRESIEQVSRLILLAEKAASECLADSTASDRNNAFLNWVTSHQRYDLTTNVTVQALPDDVAVPLGELKKFIGARTPHYYAGSDKQIISTFSGEASVLFQIAQSNPRRNVQLHFISGALKIPQVPDTVRVTRIYETVELTLPEAAIQVRIVSILRDDYLISDSEVVFADISHGVAVYAEKPGSTLKIYLARSSGLIPPLLEFYAKAYEIFTQFMKDFVRNSIYPRIQQFVPSSTKDGVEALRKVLQKNRELFRYEETERGDLEGVLGDYLSGVEPFVVVLNAAIRQAKVQTQTVSRDQVGSVEAAVPGISEAPIASTDNGATNNNHARPEDEARPPIMRDGVESPMKILTTSERYPLLNNFSMLLGLSDRLMRTEADFFHIPHTTRILWGGHRVVYIFSDKTARLSLYYDIQLRSAIADGKAGGSMFPTTTLITKNRIFVPVPDELVEDFKIGDGPKEFFVRFDVLSNDVK